MDRPSGSNLLPIKITDHKMLASKIMIACVTLSCKVIMMFNPIIQTLKKCNMMQQTPSVHTTFFLTTIYMIE